MFRKFLLVSSIILLHELFFETTKLNLLFFNRINKQFYNIINCIFVKNLLGEKVTNVVLIKNKTTLIQYITKNNLFNKC